MIEQSPRTRLQQSGSNCKAEENPGLRRNVQFLINGQILYCHV